mmetsp:Transcript_13506/g.30275  ORF Transcript_13506/g.30275 Transcript_13506/m.30275 type:complete len:236 (-) Transcript_13506:142-849(-)
MGGNLATIAMAARPEPSPKTAARFFRFWMRKKTSYIRGRVSSDIDVLQALHDRYPWVPGRQSIRPSPWTLEFKIDEMKEIQQSYKSIEDYILITVFGVPARKSKLLSPCTHSLWLQNSPHRVGTVAKLEAITSLISTRNKFMPNKFGYEVPKGCNHYVLWYSQKRGNFEHLSDDEISNDIQSNLEKKLGHRNFQFIWYENPKMSIPSARIHHVQVFWVDNSKGPWERYSDSGMFF